MDDKQILYGFVAGFALNCVLTIQMLYYWNAPSAKARGKRQQEAPVPAPAAKTSGASYASVAATASSTAATAASSASPKNAAGKGPTTRRRG